MFTAHFEHWPKRLTRSLTVPKTTLDDNMAVAARRYPDKAAIYYYGNSISYARLLEETERVAGYLQQELGVAKGDRVLLYMQNSPQFVISYYAILRAGGTVVPVNPMNRTEEVRFYLEDCGIKVAFAGQELVPFVLPLISDSPLCHVVVAAYSEYADPEFPMELPEEVKLPVRRFERDGVIYWSELISAALKPDQASTASTDMAVLPYTSGTTGRPKGCIHTHETVQANVVATVFWSSFSSNSVVLAPLPFFHVTGMQHSMNAPLFIGSSIVLMTRWNREVAAMLVETHRCTHWTNISTMVIDFLANPKLHHYDLSSLRFIGGGGAALPRAVGEKLLELTGVKYAEGYGLSETISQTHSNPPEHPKMQCMGIPSFDVDARVVHPETLELLGPHEEGEVIVHGPQVFKGYWNRPEETAKAFIELEGKTFFRTGDIAKYDEDGYFFMVDRLKRMINASGYKVWPTEVESILYKHPAVQQACVIGSPDERRGETVKAFVVLQESARGTISEEELILWAKEQMAAYKYPRIVKFVEELPISGSGKVMWRKLQEEEYERAKLAQQG